MSGEDVTRETSLNYSRGVREAIRWEWGPFSAFRVEFQSAGTSYCLQFRVWRYSWQVSMTVLGYDYE
jgi:hypothetical protein